MYISSKQFEHMAGQIDSMGSSVQGVEKALLFAALASGCKALDVSANQTQAKSYYRVATDTTWSVISGRPSITKIQVCSDIFLDLRYC